MGCRSQCVPALICAGGGLTRPVALEPPMPIYLFNLVAGLREKNAKGYPVKKVRPTPSLPR